MMSKLAKGILVFVSVFYFGISSYAQENSGPIPEYFSKMDQFTQLTKMQLSRFGGLIAIQSANEQIQNQMRVIIYTQGKILDEKIKQLKDLYTKIFITNEATPEEKKSLVSFESNLSIAIQRQLDMARTYWKTIQLGENTEARQKKFIADFSEITERLKSNSPQDVPVSMGLQQVLQARRAPFQTTCRLIGSICMRKSLSEMLDTLDAHNFLRADQVDFQNFKPIQNTLDEAGKSVFILIGNHDQPLYDIVLAREVALKLGSEHHMTMTRKSVYPVPPPESAGDVVYVVDNDPKSNPVKASVEALKNQFTNPHVKRVSLAVYPEGMLPYTGGQMPMTTKDGAYIIARKLSNELAAQGIKVFLVEMKTNMIEHLTSEDMKPPQVRLNRIELVPSNAIQKGVRDPWSDQQRLLSENSFNSHRGETQMDILNLKKAKNSVLPLALKKPFCSRLLGQ